MVCTCTYKLDMDCKITVFISDFTFNFIILYTYCFIGVGKHYEGGSATVQTSRKVNVSCGRSACVPHPARGQVASWLWVLCGRLAPTCARGSKHAGNGNQFLGVVKLPEGAIVELELGINKKPTKM